MQTISCKSKKKPLYNLEIWEQRKNNIKINTKYQFTKIYILKVARIKRFKYMGELV